MERGIVLFLIKASAEVKAAEIFDVVIDPHFYPFLILGWVWLGLLHKTGFFVLRGLD